MFLVNVFAKEVDLGLILVLGGSSLAEALVVEVEQLGDHCYVLNCLKELDIDPISSTTLF